MEEIEAIVGNVERPRGRIARPEAPGQLTRHYATQTPLQILREDDLAALPRYRERVGLITLGLPRRGDSYTSVEVLSSSSDLREAAANLFAALRRLDSQRLDRLVAFPMPETGLGLAIMDRLRRCSAGESNSEEDA